jgi:hypothetical protein
MDHLNQLKTYLNRVASDARLKPSHISLFTALCRAWLLSDCKNPYTVSRRQLMRASHLNSKTTYHKAISDLQRLGYIQYQPSFHPHKASSICMI